MLLFRRFADVVRGSDVTTIDGGRFCGAANAVGFGNELDTGRHTQANIFDVIVQLGLHRNRRQKKQFHYPRLHRFIKMNG